MWIQRFPTPNFAAGREGHEPRAFVLHTTAGTFAGTVSWFADPTSGVSAHYLVGTNGDVAWFVDEGDTARHAGRVHDPVAPFVGSGSDPNLITIGIEFEDGGDPHGCPRPDVQYEVGAELLWAIAERWSIPLDRAHVVGHREVYARKTCPGNLDLDRLITSARALDAEA